MSTAIAALLLFAATAAAVSAKRVDDGVRAAGRRLGDRAGDDWWDGAVSLRDRHRLVSNRNLEPALERDFEVAATIGRRVVSVPTAVS